MGIDMCFQGDVEIIHDWKRHTSIDKLKRVVEEKGYSAVCVGSFGHAALKSFDYQPQKTHCKKSQGYTNELHIWFPSGMSAKPDRVEAPRPPLPAGFHFRPGYGEATRGDQIGHITSGGIENHCFKGDKMSWPLHWAAMIGDVGAIDALVSAGHDPNVKMTDWFDSEPLGCASAALEPSSTVSPCATHLHSARSRGGPIDSHRRRGRLVWTVQGNRGTLRSWSRSASPRQHSGLHAVVGCRAREAHKGHRADSGVPFGGALDWGDAARIGRRRRGGRVRHVWQGRRRQR